MYELGGIFMDYYENRKVIAEAQHIYKKSMEEKSEDGKYVNSFKLSKINPEIVGWITMDDTQINYQSFKRRIMITIYFVIIKARI